MIELLDWLLAKGGWGAVMAGLFAIGLYLKDREVKQLHAERKKESRTVAVLLHGLLEKYGQHRPVTLPDNEEEETTGIINVKDKLVSQARAELEPGIEEIVKAYLKNGNGNGH